MTEQEILSKIKSYQYIAATKRELDDQLESVVYKITATYGDAAGGAAGGFSSKVERVAIKREKMLAKIRRKELEIREIKKLIECSGLNEQEQEILWTVARAGNLRRYARDNALCKSYVYKIRDKAVKKIAARLQNVGK